MIDEDKYWVSKNAYGMRKRPFKNVMGHKLGLQISTFQKFKNITGQDVSGKASLKKQQIVVVTGNNNQLVKTG